HLRAPADGGIEPLRRLVELVLRLARLARRRILRRHRDGECRVSAPDRGRRVHGLLAQGLTAPARERSVGCGRARAAEGLSGAPTRRLALDEATCARIELSFADEVEPELGVEAQRFEEERVGDGRRADRVSQAVEEVRLAEIAVAVALDGA